MMKICLYLKTSIFEPHKTNRDANFLQIRGAAAKRPGGKISRPALLCFKRLRTLIPTANTVSSTPPYNPPGGFHGTAGPPPQRRSTLRPARAGRKEPDRATARREKPVLPHIPQLPSGTSYTLHSTRSHSPGSCRPFPPVAHVQVNRKQAVPHFLTVILLR